MKEIKFRVWDTVSELWVAGWKLTQSGVSSEEKGYVWMQYTGLKDKNGKEIYEGDILAVKFDGVYIERIDWEGTPDAICEVYWDYAGFGLKAKGEKDFRYSSFEDLLHKATFPDMLMMSKSESEVIGNIYENPELLNPNE